MWASTRGRSAGRRRHVEAVRREPRHDAVVHDVAVLLQHQAVAAAARLELQPGIGVDAVHELGGIRPDDLDLAERGGIEDARRPSRTAWHSRATAACMSSPACGKYQARCHRPTFSNTAPCATAQSCDRRRAHRIEQRAAAGADEGAEGDGRIGRPEGRGADGRDGPVEDARDEPEGVHVRRLALVGRHAGRRVALDVLDRFEALAHRELDVLRGDVVLEIDEGAAAGGLCVGRQDRARA